MKRTTLKVTKMDCHSEEQMIRMKLSDLSVIYNLEFDIPNRLLHIVHSGENKLILKHIESLKLDASILSTVLYDQEVESTIQSNERRMLWYVLLINFSFFLIEMVAGLIANSMGVVADSLDMLADSVVYGLALLAVGGTIKLQNNIAKSAGVFQIILAMIGFIEILRRFIGIEKMPDFYTMIFVSVFALIANIICLYLLQMSKSKEAHMQASMIFTSNDIIINVGVIVAAVFVNIYNSSYPDLLIGAIVFLLVARGAYRIMQLAK